MIESLRVSETPVNPAPPVDSLAYDHPWNPPPATDHGIRSRRLSRAPRATACRLEMGATWPLWFDGFTASTPGKCG
jgi:hypothetical protein